MNGCATGGCHSTSDARELQLNRDLVRGVANRESTLRNLQAVMRVIDRETPEYSPLLLQPAVPHGGLPRAVFDGHRRVPEQRLADARQALEELVRFRKAHEHTYFTDLLWVTSFWERPRWDLDTLETTGESGR